MPRDLRADDVLRSFFYHNQHYIIVRNVSELDPLAGEPQWEARLLAPDGIAIETKHFVVRISNTGYRCGANILRLLSDEEQQAYWFEKKLLNLKVPNA